MTELVAVAFLPAPDARPAVEVAFAALRRWNPGLPLALVSTEPPPDELAAALRGHDVETRLVPHAHRPPAGFLAPGGRSTYPLDALDALLGNGSGRVLLLDPAVVCARPLDQVLDRVRDDAVLAHDLHRSPWHSVDGLSGLDALLLHARIDPELTGMPRQHGGELYGFTPATWERTAPAAERAWRFGLERWERRLAPRFHTGEQLLDFAFRRVPVRPANRFVRRIRTGPAHRTVTGAELGLALWSLPDERERGLRRLLPAARDREGWFWTADGDEWRARAGREFGIPARTPHRLARDVADRTALSARRRIAALPAPRRAPATFSSRS